jgi:cell division transport system permease protein
LRRFYDFPWENPLQNSYDIHLKAEYVGKTAFKIEKQLRTNPMISDIVYDKQLVNLVNDNIKKSEHVDLIISGF